MNKRLFAILLSALSILTLAACGNNAGAPASTPDSAAAAAPAEPTPASDTVSEPETSAALVRYREIGVLYAALKAGDTLHITAEDGDWYAVELEGVTVWVEKRFLRLTDQQPAEPQTRYARDGATAYGDVYLRGEALCALSRNTPVTLLEELGECALVTLADGTQVFLPSDMLSEQPITGYAGGSAPAGADGGDITFTGFAPAQQPKLTQLTAGAPAAIDRRGMVKADGAEAYLRILRRGDEVSVLSRQGELTELLMDGNIGTVPTEALLAQGETAYEGWDGFLQESCKGSADLRLLENGDELARNTPVRVVDQFGSVYLVETAEDLVYVPAAAVGTEEAPAQYAGGNGGGTADWTPPIL